MTQGQEVTQPRRPKHCHMLQRGWRPHQKYHAQGQKPGVTTTCCTLAGTGNVPKRQNHEVSRSEVARGWGQGCEEWLLLGTGPLAGVMKRFWN